MGYNAFYDQLLAQNNGLDLFKGSCTDKVSLTHNKLDTEKKMLKGIIGSFRDSEEGAQQTSQVLWEC